MNENLYEEYDKVKSLDKASIFYKKKNLNYKKQSKFVTEYFSKMSNDEIIKLIDLYVRKRAKAHKKRQLTLKTIIKKPYFFKSFKANNYKRQTAFKLFVFFIFLFLLIKI